MALSIHPPAPDGSEEPSGPRTAVSVDKYLRSLGYGHSAVEYAKNARNGHESEEDAVAYLERFVARGWTKPFLTAILNRDSILRAVPQDSLFAVQDVLEGPCDIPRPEAIRILMQKKSLPACDPAVLLANIDAAIGTRETDAVIRLLDDAGMTVAGHTAKDLARRRALLLKWEMDPIAYPELLSAEELIENKQERKHDNRDEEESEEEDSNIQGSKLIIPPRISLQLRFYANRTDGIKELERTLVMRTLYAARTELGLMPEDVTRQLAIALPLLYTRRLNLRATRFALEGQPPADRRERTEMQELLEDAYRFRDEDVRKVMEFFTQRLAFGKELAQRYLVEHLELLSANARPLAIVASFVTHYGLKPERATALIRQPLQYATLFEEVHQFDYPGIVKNMRQMTAEAARYGLDRDDIDPVYDWTRFFMPTVVLKERIVRLPPGIGLTKKEETLNVLYAPTEEAFTSQLETLLRS